MLKTLSREEYNVDDNEFCKEVIDVDLSSLSMEFDSSQKTIDHNSQSSIRYREGGCGKHG